MRYLIRQNIPQHHHERLPELEHLLHIRFNGLTCSPTELVLLLYPPATLNANGVI